MLWMVYKGHQTNKDIQCLFAVLIDTWWGTLIQSIINSLLASLLTLNNLQPNLCTLISMFTQVGDDGVAKSWG